MSRSSFVGYIRQYGSTKKATPTPSLQALKFTFDPTQSSISVSKTLPKGAIVFQPIQIVAGATGGTNPTVNVGISSDPDYFAVNMAADTISLVQPGVGYGVTLSSDTEVYAGVGASAATGGTITCSLMYFMDDDGTA